MSMINSSNSLNRNERTDSLTNNSLHRDLRNVGTLSQKMSLLNNYVESICARIDTEARPGNIQSLADNITAELTTIKQDFFSNGDTTEQFNDIVKNTLQAHSQSGQNAVSVTNKVLHKLKLPILGSIPSAPLDLEGMCRPDVVSSSAEPASIRPPIELLLSATLVDSSLAPSTQVTINDLLKIEQKNSERITPNTEIKQAIDNGLKKIYNKCIKHHKRRRLMRKNGFKVFPVGILATAARSINILGRKLKNMVLNENKPTLKIVEK
jgi:hypothetical protein